MSTEINPMKWFDRKFEFGKPIAMFPFYLERMEGTMARLEYKTKNITDEIMSEKFNGKWSIKQNIGHLAEVDDISNKRIDEIINGITPMSPAVFEPKYDYNAQPIYEVLKFFRDNRTRNLIKYRNIKESDLQKSSLHPRLQLILTPVDLALFEAEHDDHHLVTINEIIKTFSK
jgi:hypothetical protein